MFLKIICDKIIVDGVLLVYVFSLKINLNIYTFAFVASLVLFHSLIMQDW